LELLSGRACRRRIDRLTEDVLALEGLRHGRENYPALERRARYIEERLRSLGAQVTSQPVSLRGRNFRNVIGTLAGTDPETPLLLIGAHYDAAPGSPGADDNASGVAVLLETARLMTRQRLRNSIQFVAFTLEEAQTLIGPSRFGSRRFAREAKKAGRRYLGAFILESVGYRDETEGSQRLPPLIKVNVPDRGNFLGVIGNRRSEPLMQAFCRAAADGVPELPVVPYRVPFSGLLLPQTRFSDHVAFWNCGYPALMLTDTAMFRNPHYHRPTDTAATLDYSFMAAIAEALGCFLNNHKL
jgi:aminopeptidase YwaD